MTNCTQTIIKFSGATIILTLLVCFGIFMWNFFKKKPPACPSEQACTDPGNPCGSTASCRTQPCKEGTCQNNSIACSPGSECSGHQC